MMTVQKYAGGMPHRLRLDRLIWSGAECSDLVHELMHEVKSLRSEISSLEELAPVLRERRNAARPTVHGVPRDYWRADEELRVAISGLTTARDRLQDAVVELARYQRRSVWLANALEAYATAYANACADWYASQKRAAQSLGETR